MEMEAEPQTYKEYIYKPWLYINKHVRIISTTCQFPQDKLKKELPKQKVQRKKKQDTPVQ